MTLTKVAEKAGVSLPTVSRVLNNRKGVSEKTASLVRQAMEEIGFVPPPPMVRGLSDQRMLPGVENGNIAFLWTVPIVVSMGGVGAWLLEGATKAAADNGLNLVVDFISQAKKLPPMVDEGKVDGVILHGAEPPESFTKKLRRMSSVWMLTTGVRDWGDRVGPNNDRIGELAVQTLVGAGHKHLACITYDRYSDFPGKNYWHERAEAFDFHAGLAGVSSVTIGESEPWCEQKDWPDLIDRIVTEYMALTPRPTGVFVATDIIPEVYHALKNKGIEPMRDVDLIATDRTETRLRGIDPEPFWIDIRVSSIGYMAVEQLLWRLAHSTMDRVRLTVEPRLLLGK